MLIAFFVGVAEGGVQQYGIPGSSNGIMILTTNRTSSDYNIIKLRRMREIKKRVGSINLDPLSRTLKKRVVLKIYEADNR